MPNTLKEGLTKLLKESIDVFSRQSFDMSGVPMELIEHKLNDRPRNKPIHAKKKKGQSKDRNKEINDEVDKLVNTRIVRESLFPSWVANPVLGKKEDEE